MATKKRLAKSRLRKKKGAVIKKESRPFGHKKAPNFFPLLRKILAVFLIVEGMILLIQSIYIHGPVVGSFFKKKAESAVSAFKKDSNNRFGTVEVLQETLLQQKESAHPKRILIPKIGLEQSIEDGKITDGQWNISESGVSFMVGSCTPGNSCNIVIYGHAKEQFFGPLKKIKIGDSITILTETKWYLYKVNEIKDVSPEQVSVIGPTLEETLTLFTCTAFLDSKRLVVVAKRI